MFPIRFQNVSQFFGEQKILDDINLDIEKNKITVIIGKTGAGKSTLLKMVNGLVKPSGGKVFVFENEIDYNNLPELRLKIGYSVQGTGLFPHMTAYENISLLGRINNWDKNKIDERVNELIKLVHFGEHLLQKHPYQLSGGEQQRAGIVRAMFLNPKIYLLDEAFSSLDPETRTDIHKEILHIQQTEPRTILLVTHDMHEAKTLGDKILRIEKHSVIPA
ncbi:MAG TPA: ATP-binding cassette domain-containing protein [Ignavibacteria bacterium]|nr:ATP-binding cassette domain-containing protein [Ignavibacteria bacterium]